MTTLSLMSGLSGSSILFVCFLESHLLLRLRPRLRSPVGPPCTISISRLPSLNIPPPKEPTPIRNPLSRLCLVFFSDGSWNNLLEAGW